MLGMSDVPATDAEYLRRRYGAHSSDRRALWLVAGLLIALAAAWFIWQVVAVNRNDVTAEAVAIGPVSDSQVGVTFNVMADPGSTVSCTVRAYTANLTEVGVKEVTVGPVARDLTTVRTSLSTVQRATGARVGDCHLVSD